jgi:hypothetical protein
MGVCSRGGLRPSGRALGASCVVTLARTGRAGWRMAGLVVEPAGRGEEEFIVHAFGRVFARGAVAVVIVAVAVGTGHGAVAVSGSAGSGQAWLYGVSCPARGYCLAVGGRTAGNVSEQTSKRKRVTVPTLSNVCRSATLRRSGTTRFGSIAPTNTNSGAIMPCHQTTQKSSTTTRRAAP